jgi:hypothetical protein
LAERRRGLAALLALAAVVGCGRRGDELRPAAGFGALSGQTVLVLPVQYVQRVPGGWAGGTANSREAARQADVEIAFALGEQGGRANWVTADKQVEAVRRKPWVSVDPRALSADEARRKGAKLRDVKDPLYGEIRVLAALFNSRYAVWPLEVIYEADEEAGSGRLAIRTFLLDVRRGSVLWYGVVRGRGEQPLASPGALASLAQEFASFVSP